jgi:hypothetical protein
LTVTPPSYSNRTVPSVFQLLFTFFLHSFPQNIPSGLKYKEQKMCFGLLPSPTLSVKFWFQKLAQKSLTQSFRVFNTKLVWY